MSEPIQEFHNVTPDIFARDIRPLVRPAVLRGLVADWPSVLKGQAGAEGLFAYLTSLDNGQPQGTLVGDPSINGRFHYSDDLRGQNYSFEKQTVSEALSSLLAMKKGDPSRYIQSILIEQHMPDFTRDHTMPLIKSNVPPRAWIGGETVVQTHYDLSENIACVVLGRRRFTLFPADQLPNMYLGPVETAPGGASVSLTDLENPDYERQPKFKAAMDQKQEVELLPGDAIYIPPGWFHHVRALGPLNMLVNYWWRDRGQVGQPFAAFMHALLAFKTLPAGQKDVWRHMFDYMVFEKTGDAMAHLPPHMRGVFGGISDQQREQAIYEILQILGAEVGLPPPPMPPHIKKV